MAFWAYFVPIPLAVLTQETYHQAKDYRKKLIKQLYEAALGKPVESAASEDKPDSAKVIEEPPATPAELSEKIKRTESTQPAAAPPR
jgi:hypothetical protein